MALSVKNWQISQEYNGSDHNSIEFELDKEKIIVEEQYQYHKADWNLFANELRNDNIKIPNEITERRLEKCLDDAVEEKEVESIMRHQQPKLSCGIDTINNRIVKSSSIALAKPMIENSSQIASTLF